MDLLRMLLIKSLFLIYMTVVESKVEWYITSDPVQIGSDLELFCNTTQNFCKNCTSQWIAGSAVLAFNDKVIDSSKYAVSRKKDGFTLIIKHLTVADIHRRYGCTYNFDIFTKNLTLPVTFEYQPTKDTTNGSHSLTGRDLHLTYVFEKVHPKPICSVHLDEEDLSSKLTTTVSRRGIFLNVKVEMKHTFRVYQTGGNLLLECSVGTRTGTYYDTYIGADDGHPLWIIIGIVCVIVLILVIFIVYMMIFLKRQRGKIDMPFYAFINHDSLCKLFLKKKNTEPTDSKTVKESSSVNEGINKYTADALNSREDDHITPLLSKEPVSDEIVPTKNEKETSTLILIKEYENEPKPSLSVPHDDMRSDSSGSSDIGIDCLARDRQQNCNNGTENDQSKLSTTSEEYPSDGKRDHATLQKNYENDVVQRDKSDSSALNENCENHHSRSNFDLPLDLNA